MTFAAAAELSWRMVVSSRTAGDPLDASTMASSGIVQEMRSLSWKGRMVDQPSRGGEWRLFPRFQ